MQLPKFTTHFNKPVFLTLTLRKEYKLRVSENWVLRKMFVARRNEATGS
jgi:hypothetical protein